MRRVWTGLLAAAVAAVGAPALTGSAQALQAPVAFISNASSTYQTNGIAWSVAQAQGLVFVGGTFTSVRPAGAAKGTGEVPRNNLVVLDAATGAPTSCSPSVTDGAAAATSVKSLTVSPDGRTLYVGGYFGKVDGAPRYNLAALDIASCSFISSFAPDPNSTVLAIAATDTTVYYGGVFNASDGVSRSHAAAAVAVGTAGTGDVLPWAPVFDQDVRALALRPGGGSVVAGGDFDTVNGTRAHALVVLDPATASIQKSWATTGGTSDFINPLSDVHDITTDATGFYTGHEGHGTNVFDGRMAIDWSTLDLRWRDSCLGATQAVVVYKGLLYSGSHAHNCSSMGAFPDGPRNHLLAESVDKPVLQPWFPQTNDGIGEALGPRDMVVAPNGTSGDAMWVVGEFTTVNGVAQQGITRFGQGTDTAGPSAATSTVSSPRAGEVRVAWRQSLDTDDALLTYRVYRDAETVPVATVQATSWFWERRQMVFTDTGLAPGSKHTYRVEATDGLNVNKGAVRSVVVGSSSSAYADRVLADGAVSLWRYDEAGDVLVSDASDKLANGTIRGSATLGVAGALAADPSRAITLGGATTTIYAEAPRTLTASAPFSAETWFRTTTTVGGKILGIGDKQIAQSAANDKHIYMNTTGQLVWGVGNNGVATRITSPAAYNDGAWHHVVATVGAGGMTLYVDGALVKANTAVRSSATFTRGYLRVGGDKLSSGTWPGATSEFWVGSLDETAVYAGQLTAAQVKAHHDAAGTAAPADTTAPAAPAGVTATAADQTVTVSWQPSSDPSGIAGYDLYRGTSADVATTGTPLASTTTATTRTDTPGPGTWYYRVVARDGAGNASAGSEAASVTVATPPPPPPPPPATPTTTTVTLPATADAYGNAGAPSTTFGSSSSLSSRGSVGATSYLRFAVPAAPAGTTLVGASLKVRTSTDTGAGSVDAQTISLVPGAWEEATLTWNNRPALGATIGSIPGGTTANTALTAALDPAALAGTEGTSVSVAVSARGSDVFWLWSRNYATASARPQLVLTYQG